LLIICSIVSAVPLPAGTTKEPTLKQANKALDPSITKKAKALLTGKPLPKNPDVADIKNTDSVAVRNQDKQVFTVDKNKPIAKGEIANGARTSVYEAKNHSDPSTPTVMKVSQSTNKGLTTPGIPSNPGQIEAKSKATRENAYNERMGISAGKPVAITNGRYNETFLPMKKVDGVPLSQALRTPKKSADPNYMSSHRLLENTRYAINETNRKGISHNNANAGNVMVTKDKGKMISYGNATDLKPGIDRLNDHKSMSSSLNGMRKDIPPSRLNSFNDAVGDYDDQIRRAEGSLGKQ
jgi:hypothetical protein